MNKTFALRAFLICCCIITKICLWSYFDISAILDEQWMDSYVKNQGYHGIFIYIGAVTVFTAMGVPRQACSLLGGYVFGMWYGTLWATIGTAIACILSFSFARFVGQEWLHQRYEKKLSNFNSFLGHAPFLLTLVVRIIPLGSNFLTNYLAGMSRIPATAFLSGSTIGFTVQNFIFATMGSGLRINEDSKLLISIALYVVSLSLGYWVYRKYKNHKKKPTSQEQNICPQM